MISSPALEAIRRREAALRKANKQLESYDRAYVPLVAKLTETEFLSLYMATTDEMNKRWPMREGEDIPTYIDRIKVQRVDKIVEEMSRYVEADR